MFNNQFMCCEYTTKTDLAHVSDEDEAFLISALQDVAVRLERYEKNLKTLRIAKEDPHCSPEQRTRLERLADRIRKLREKDLELRWHVRTNLGIEDEPRTIQ